MYKRGLVGFCIILVLLIVSVFAGGQTSTLVDGHNITLSWNFTGDEYHFLTTDTSYEFSASLLNQTSTLSLTNTSAQCYLNLSTESELLNMSFNDSTQSFLHTTVFDTIQKDASYSILCNSTSFTLESETHVFDVSQELKPQLITVFAENGTVVSTLKYYSWIDQPVYVVLENVSNQSKVTNPDLENRTYIENAFCSINIFNKTYNLTFHKDYVINDTKFDVYRNDSVFFSDYGDITYSLDCEYESLNYIWNDTLVVNEYKPTFSDSGFDFGNAFDQNRALNLLFSNQNLFAIHSENIYEYFIFGNNGFSSIYDNAVSNINKNSILSLVSEEIILNFGPETPSTDFSRFH